MLRLIEKLRLGQDFHIPVGRGDLRLAVDLPQPW